MHFLWQIFNIAIAFAAPQSGNAGSGGGTLNISNPLGAGCEIDCVVQHITGAIFYISIPITVIMVLIGGFQMLLSGGNEEKVRSAKNTLMYAAIGFAIVLLSGGATSIIQSIIGGGSSGGASPSGQSQSAPTNNQSPSNNSTLYNLQNPGLRPSRPVNTQ